MRAESLPLVSDILLCDAGPEKYFLYEIVSNKLTGVDVDKVGTELLTVFNLTIDHFSGTTS